MHICFEQYADCLGNKEEGAGYVRWYVPNALGYTRAAMLHSKGCDTER